MISSIHFQFYLQSIGYANLAGLDPEYGLCKSKFSTQTCIVSFKKICIIKFDLKIYIPDTSVVPPLIYSMMGSSRELAIGPVAVVSLLLSSMVRDLQDPVTDPIAYRKIVFTTTFIAGAFQAIFGLFRQIFHRYSL